MQVPLGTSGQSLFRRSREDGDSRSAFFALASLMMILATDVADGDQPAKDGRSSLVTIQTQRDLYTYAYGYRGEDQCSGNPNGLHS